ncbi:hypothetical protein TNCT_243871 [Trichonephila clavata]|uniref:Uncharacterized protein n=1 Tax=Trichonephila clavata TaxID=2740835 RepID=A0A8X6H293_TRICU|nr:hypothetical protein TNCT_243871 [Trichonephila clavata]
MAWGDWAKSEEKKVMSKIWVFVYRNANDNHIIAVTEEFSDEFAPLRRLGRLVLRNKGQGRTVALESAPTEQSCFSTSIIGQGVPGHFGKSPAIVAIHFQYIGHWPQVPANVRFGRPIRELTELRALAIAYIV